MPHVLVKVHQLLDAHFGSRLEQDASTQRIESAHDAGDCVAHQTTLGIRTSCSSFFIGTSQAGLPLVGQFVGIRSRSALISSTLAWENGSGRWTWSRPRL